MLVWKEFVNGIAGFLISVTVQGYGGVYLIRTRYLLTNLATIVLSGIGSLVKSHVPFFESPSFPNFQVLAMGV